MRGSCCGTSPHGRRVHQAAEALSGRVLSVNVAEPRLIETGQGLVMSGIDKQPVKGARMMRALGFEGDRQANLAVHGGPYKAVYVYPHEHYADWAAELSREAGAPGWFGENLTTTGLLETTVRIGDALRVGGALVEVTQPRTPCFKLTAKMRVHGFERMFHRSGRSGWYVAVLEEGLVQAGDAVTLEATAGGPTVLEALRE